MIKRLIFSLLFAFSILFLLPEPSSAELYLGIGPFDNLSMLKTKFPNAIFTREKPAWAQDHEVIYTIVDPIIRTIV